MSIDAGAQVAIILLLFGPCVVIVNLLGQVCTLGRVPRTKETLLDFREWCWVTRHPRVFHGLTGCQRTPRFWGVTGGEGKVNPRNKGYTWVPKSWSFVKLHKVGNFPTCVISSLKVI